MELRHLQALVAVSEQGSFSAAADFLGTVQSNISAHVARLEREVGATLVDRAAGRLTAEGEVVASRAYRVLAELDALIADVAALREEVVGTVRAGMIGTTARWLMPVLLEDIAQHHPKLHLIVSEGTTATLEPLLTGGRLDLALLTSPVPGHDISFEPLFEEDVVLVVPREDDLLAQRKSLSLGELPAHVMLAPAPGTPFRSELDAVLRPANIRLRPRAELDGVRLIASLTFEGHGPALLPASAVPPHLRPSFRLLAVDGLPRRTVGLGLRTRGMPSAPARAVLSTMRRLVRAPDHLPEGIHALLPEAVARAEGAVRAIGVPNG